MCPNSLYLKESYVRKVIFPLEGLSERKGEKRSFLSLQLQKMTAPFATLLLGQSERDNTWKHFNLTVRKSPKDNIQKGTWRDTEECAFSSLLLIQWNAAFSGYFPVSGERFESLVTLHYSSLLPYKSPLLNFLSFRTSQFYPQKV